MWTARPRLSAGGRDRKDPIPIGTLAEICPMSAIAPSGALASSAPLSGFSREANLDADRLSHPTELDAVVADARLAALTVVLLTPDDT